MLDEGVWAEIKVGNEHLRLFSERNAQGIQASVYNVAAKQWIAPSEEVSDIEHSKERNAPPPTPSPTCARLPPPPSPPSTGKAPAPSNGQRPRVGSPSGGTCLRFQRRAEFNSTKVRETAHPAIKSWTARPSFENATRPQSTKK